MEAGFSAEALGASLRLSAFTSTAAAGSGDTRADDEALLLSERVWAVWQSTWKSRTFPLHKCRAVSRHEHRMHMYAAAMNTARKAQLSV